MSRATDFADFANVQRQLQWQQLKQTVIGFEMREQKVQDFGDPSSSLFLLRALVPPSPDAGGPATSAAAAAALLAQATLLPLVTVDRQHREQQKPANTHTSTHTHTYTLLNMICDYCL